jgi:arylsulfatase A-like enzyme
MPDRRSFMGTLLGALGAASIQGAPAQRPNILLIVADDLGWADVGYHGSPLRTPNLDRLSRNGAELDQHYVAPVCSPTRAALLSGRYWSRFGVTSPQAEQAFPFGTVTLASALKMQGYETCIAGKWHLGSQPEWGPRKFGFDHSYGAFGGGTGPWDHRYKKGPYTRNWHRNDQYVEEQGHVTDLICREAIAFLKAPRRNPFFLYVPFTAVHHPLSEPSEWLKANAAVEAGRRQYAACVQHMDDAVGSIIEALEKTGQRANTLVVFTSDNGGMGRPAADLNAYPGSYESGSLGENQPLRGHKGQLYEGGIRVPAFVNWPGRIAARKIAAPIHAVDWTPTLSTLAGYVPSTNLKWDGQDVWPTIAGGEKPAPRDLYWKGPGGRSYALRSGDWKLVVHGAGDAQRRVELDGQRRVEVFDLARDPFEENDRASDEPAVVKRLEKLLSQQQKMDDDAVPGGGRPRNQ